MNIHSKREKAWLLIGVILVVMGIAVNEWTLLALYSNDGVAEPVHRILVAIFDLITIGSGTLLIIFRRSVKPGNLILLGVSLLLCLSIAEVTLGFLEHDSGEIPLFIANPKGSGSYRLKPNFTIKTGFGRSETQGITIKTNSRGMHWREVDTEKPLDKKRIAFTGDSFTFGLWADRVENSFVGVCDSLMDQTKYEILNFGVCGYGLADIELQIKEEVLDFSPDYLVVMFYDGNDFRDTFLGINKYDIVNGVATWSDKSKGIIAHKAEDAERKEKKDNKIVSFVLNRALYRRLSGLVTRMGSGKRLNPIVDYSRDDMYTSVLYWSRTDDIDFIRQCTNKTRDVLDNIRKLAQENQCKLIIVSIPTREQVHSFRVRDNGYNIGLPQKHLRDYALSNSVFYFDLLDALRLYVREQGRDVYLQHDGHFNANGHRVVGELIARFLKENVING